MLNGFAFQFGNKTSLGAERRNWSLNAFQEHVHGALNFFEKLDQFSLNNIISSRYLVSVHEISPRQERWKKSMHKTRTLCLPWPSNHFIASNMCAGRACLWMARNLTSMIKMECYKKMFERFYVPQEDRLLLISYIEILLSKTMK